MDNLQRYIYRGAIHIHTKHSDGTGDLMSVTRAAKSAGLDWIIITDHNYYDREEGIINGVYVIKAQEISPPQSNHYLAFGIDKTIQPAENPSDYVNEVRSLGGFGFAAHPDEGYIINKDGAAVPRKNSHHCIPWTDKNIVPDGIEIWNWFSNWADNLDDSCILKMAYAYYFKHNIITNPSKLTLDWWDKLNNESSEIVPAIGGVDAHALKFYKYVIPVTVFPYKMCFSTITNIINLKEKLSEDFSTAKSQILSAIRQGRNMIANLHISQKIPEIYVTTSGNTYYCGEEIKADEKCCLHFETTDNMEICLIYNGKEIKRYNTNSFIHPVTHSGKYRLEISYKGKGFLYTNPFNIKD